MNRKLMALLPVIVMASLLLTGCQAIGEIFKAGVWVGIIIVVIVVLIIVRLFSRNKS